MKSLRRGDIALLALSWLLALVISCGSGGGGGNDNTPPPNTVSIQSAVNVGNTPPTPVPNATCQFIDRTGTVQGQTTADASGAFILAVPPQVQGNIRCTPASANLDQLALLTFASTQGAAAGTTLPPTGQEIVSPQTTLIATIIAQENPADPQARKAELLTQLADPNSDLSIAGSAAAVLYQQLLQSETNVGFDVGSEGDVGDTGEGEGGGTGGGGTDSGGVSGDVGDGADFSPIPNAVCEAAAGLDAEGALFTAPLHDLLAAGRVSRPDMQAVADAVNQALAGREEAIKAAFAQLFPQDIGQRLRTTATGEDSPTPGHYFLPVPAGLAGFVRCHPPEQEDLVLAVFIGKREVGQDLPSQDVNPASTLFSTQIAEPLLTEQASTPEEVVQAKENWQADLRQVIVRGTRDAAGNIKEFKIELTGPPNENAANTRLMVLTATALYTTLLKKNINADFRGVVRRFVQARKVNPADLIEETPELPPEDAENVAEVVNTSTDDAGEDLGTDPETALTTARIRVRVRAKSNQAKLSGVRVTLAAAGGNVQCVQCPQFTNNNGEATLRLRRVPTDQPVQVTVRATKQDFIAASVRQQVVALAQITADIELARPGGPGTGSGGGTD